MPLAHTLDQSGPHIEYLAVAGGFLLLGIVLFVQKSVKPIISIAIILLALGVGTGAFFVGGAPAAAGRSVVITSPKPGESVPALERFELQVAINGGKLARSPGAQSGGHLHIFVDGALVDMPTTANPMVTLKEGTHRLGVEFVDAQHVSYKPKVVDEIEVVAK